MTGRKTTCFLRWNKAPACFFVFIKLKRQNSFFGLRFRLFIFSSLGMLRDLFLKKRTETLDRSSKVWHGTGVPGALCTSQEARRRTKRKRGGGVVEDGWDHVRLEFFNSISLWGKAMSPTSTERRNRRRDYHTFERLRNSKQTRMKNHHKTIRWKHKTTPF